ncbi:MAG: hypothetical protein DDT19_02756 [Syntrophomonadaceae bacterium]|nr:hypothetical protein [Bacillota bacterium]
MELKWFDRITFNPQTMGGRACIRGMRIPVSVIVGQIAHGATIEEILNDYPDLEPKDIRQAMEYAAWLAQEEVHLVS